MLPASGLMASLHSCIAPLTIRLAVSGSNSPGSAMDKIARELAATNPVVRSQTLPISTMTRSRICILWPL